MKTNKDVKNLIDNLEEWDYIQELDYKVEEIDNDLYYISDENFKCRYLDYNELFDEIMEHYQDEEQNLHINQ